MTFSRWTFRLSGIVGLIIMFPMIFREGQMFKDDPHGLTHPEYFYGFIAVVIAWQVMFLLISHDPVKYRLAMIPAMVEKFGFILFVFWLAMGDRVPQDIIGAAFLDLLWGILFAVSFVLTGRTARAAGSDSVSSN